MGIIINTGESIGKVLIDSSDEVSKIYVGTDLVYESGLSDLTGTSWCFKTSAPTGSISTTYSINTTIYTYGYRTLTCYGYIFRIPLLYMELDKGDSIYYGIYANRTSTSDLMAYFGVKGGLVVVGIETETSSGYSKLTNYSDSSQYFSITGGTDATNPTLIKWITTNCTRIA